MHLALSPELFHNTNMKNLIAQIPLSPQGGFKGQGALGDPAGQESSLLTQVISTLIGVMTAVAFIWFVIQFFIAAVSWIGAGNDKSKVESARGNMVSAIVGLIIVVSAIFIAGLIGTVFGIPILNVDQWFNVLTPK